MKYFVAILFLLHTLPINAQDCHARFNESITGYCSAVDKCQGTVLATDTCGEQQCCIDGHAPPASPACITGGEFNALFSTPRAAFLRRILNYAVNKAGICYNCHAKAAFVAVAATMTNDFTSDEIAGTNEDFDADDNEYGNSEPGDGSKFRRRGFFGLQGREMYQRLQTLMPRYQSLRQPELVAIVENGMEIAAKQWNNPNFLNETTLTEFANGTFYGFSMLWYKLNGDMNQFVDAVRQHDKFFRVMNCKSNTYIEQGPVCQYNATHNGSCKADWIQGLESFQENCGCYGVKGPQCPNSPSHVRCCLNTSPVNFAPKLTVELFFSVLIVLFQIFLFIL